MQNRQNTKQMANLELFSLLRLHWIDQNATFSYLRVRTKRKLIIKALKGETKLVILEWKRILWSRQENTNGTWNFCYFQSPKNSRTNEILDLSVEIPSAELQNREQSILMTFLAWSGYQDSDAIIKTSIFWVRFEFTKGKQTNEVEEIQPVVSEIQDFEKQQTLNTNIIFLVFGQFGSGARNEIQIFSVERPAT